MFFFFEVSPIVIIVIAIILLSHVVISGAMLVTALTILAVSAIATAGIVYAIAAKMRSYPPPSMTYQAYRKSLEEPDRKPESITSGHGKTTEIHNHLHLEGVNPEELAAYIRSQHGGDFQ
jgi:hypothetical protein